MSGAAAAGGAFLRWSRVRTCCAEALVAMSALAARVARSALRLIGMAPCDGLRHSTDSPVLTTRLPRVFMAPPYGSFPGMQQCATGASRIPIAGASGSIALRDATSIRTCEFRSRPADLAARARRDGSDIVSVRGVAALVCALQRAPVD
jgi:hypothetical protein